MGRVLLFALLSASHLCALPTGLKPVSGEVKEPILNGSTMKIETKGDAILSWDSFSITQAEVLHFLQDGAKSAVLNQVRGMEESLLFGTLLSNGKVYLINPNGVLIGPDARIETSGFLASTFDILNLNPEDGIFEMKGTSEAKIVNLGKIECPSGDLFLVARHVENRGILSAPQGRVGIGAADEVFLLPEGRERIWIEMESSDSSIVQEGEIEALSIELRSCTNPYSMAIQGNGKMEATTLCEKGGEIFLVAQSGICDVQGEVTGKEVHILGSYVNVHEGAKVDVSGDSGGGIVQIGDARLCQGVYVGENAIIEANAIDSGNGGSVTIWSDLSTACVGTVNARGGVNGGNGGFIEVSSHQGLHTHGAIFDTSAPFGKTGTLLFDPCAVTVSAAATTVGVSPGPFVMCPGGAINYTFVGLAAANINHTDLSNYLGCNNVTINADASGTAANGSILFSSATVSWAAANTLTLTCTSANGASSSAAIDITDSTITNSSMGTPFTALSINGQNTGAGAFFGVVIQTSVGATNIQTAQGDISITGTTSGQANGVGVSIFDSAGPLTIQSTMGGAITMTGTCTNTGGRGVEFIAAQVSSTSGAIQVLGTGGATGFGIVTDVSQSIISTTGNITLNGSIPSGSGGAGISFLAGTSTSITSSGGSISLTGTHSGTNGIGINLGGAGSAGTTTISTTGNGTISLNGTRGTGGPASFTLSSGILNISSVNGNIDIVGNTPIVDVGSDISLSYTAGVFAGSNATIGTTGTGNITIQASKSIELGDATNTNKPVTIETSGGGNIVLTGGTIGSIPAIFLQNATEITTLGSGTITLTGTRSASDSPTITINGLMTHIGSANGNIFINPTSSAAITTTLAISNGVTIDSTGSGSILINAAGAGGGDISLSTNTTLQTASGDISMTHTTSGDISLTSTTLLNSTGAGDITLDTASGQILVGPNATITSTSGNILIDGTTTTASTAVVMGTTTTIAAGGAGTVQITGTIPPLLLIPALSITGNVGMPAQISTVNGNLTLTANRGSPALSIQNTATIQSTGTGSIILMTTVEGVTATNAVTINAAGSGGITFNIDGIANLSNNVQCTAAGTGAIQLTSSSDFLLSNNAVISGNGGIFTANIGDNLTLTGGAGANAPARMLFRNTTATFAIGGNLTLTGGLDTSSSAIIGPNGAFEDNTSLTFTSIGGNVTLNAGTPNSFALIGADIAAAVNFFNGNITFSSIGGNVTLNGDSLGIGTSGFAQIGHLNEPGINGFLGGSITLQTNGSISLNGGLNSTAYARIGLGGQTPGPVYFRVGAVSLTAGTSLILTTAGNGQPQIESFESTGLTIVVDNLFPTSPGIGSGAVNFASNSLITATDAELRIYTADRALNTISSPINGEAFVPGPFGVDTATEKWSIYFPGGTYGGEAFTIYYKVPFAPAPIPASTLSLLQTNLSIADAQNTDLILEIELHLDPSYEGRICWKDRKHCTKGNRFASFIFENEVR